EEIGAELERLGILGDDDAFLDRPEVVVAFPAVEVLAVKEVNRLGLALARRHVCLALFLGQAGRQAQRGGDEASAQEYWRQSRDQEVLGGFADSGPAERRMPGRAPQLIVCDKQDKDKTRANSRRVGPREEGESPQLSATLLFLVLWFRDADRLSGRHVEFTL